MCFKAVYAEITGDVQVGMGDYNILFIIPLFNHNSVYCISDNMKVSVADNVIVKGRCTGYDDLFLQVILDQCVVLE